MIFKNRFTPIYAMAIISCLLRCTCSDDAKPVQPVRFDEYVKDDSAPLRYVADEIIIMYKGIPDQAKRDSIRKRLDNANIPVDSIKIRTCNSCHAYIELWQAKDIHTVIHGEEISAGTVSGGSKGVGEDTMAI